MSYPGYPPYGAPPPHSPQPGYGAPPPGQYPPPQAGYGQPQYGAPPPQQYPGYPPQGGYASPPPPGQYGAPPPSQNYPAPTGYQQYPPPQQYPPQGYPPQQPYGAPPPQQGYPPQGQYGAPPPAQAGYYGAPPMPAPAPVYNGPPVPPSVGYATGYTPQGNATQEAEALNKAMKGFGTDEATLIRILSKPDPIQMQNIRYIFHQRYGKRLDQAIDKETSGYFKQGLLALVRGPLEQDVYNLNNAIAGLGTKEVVLNDVLCGRSNADLNAIKAEYQKTYKRSLVADVKGDLSAKTERMFDMILAARRAEESTPINPQQIEADVTELHRATEGKIGTDEISVCAIITSRSDAQLRVIAQAYEVKYRITLDRVIDKEFSGHMKSALHQIIRGAVDRVGRDAMLLEDTMAGLGTKDELLVNRVVRFHWNRAYMAQVKNAYQLKYGRTLVSRIKGETRGDYERLMVACVE